MSHDKLLEKTSDIFEAVVNDNPLILSGEEFDYLLSKRESFVHKFPLYEDITEGEYVCCVMFQEVENVELIKDKHIFSIEETFDSEEDLLKYISSLRVFDFKVKFVKFDL